MTLIENMTFLVLFASLVRIHKPPCGSLFDHFELFGLLGCYDAWHYICRHVFWLRHRQPNSGRAGKKNCITSMKVLQLVTESVIDDLQLTIGQKSCSSHWWQPYRHQCRDHRHHPLPREERPKRRTTTLQNMWWRCLIQARSRWMTTIQSQPLEPHLVCSYC
jgi:hypothetical protein